MYDLIGQPLAGSMLARGPGGSDAPISVYPDV
jgi:hypothetical protein